MRLSRRLVMASAGLLLVAATGCGGNKVAGIAAPASAGQESAEPAGFDECGLYEPRELAELLGIEAIYITGRAASTREPDGSRSAACTYFVGDLPGIGGMTLRTTTGTDAEGFFAPFDSFDNVKELDRLGDRAAAVGYKLTSGAFTTHVREVRAVSGDKGIHVRYSYGLDGGLPEADGEAVAKIVWNALERLPDDVTIADGKPEGPCAGIDLALASRVMGAELVSSRAVLSDGDAFYCHFSGIGTELEVVSATDENVVRSWRIDEPHGNVQGVGERAVVGVGRDAVESDVQTIDGTINAGRRVIRIVGEYSPQVASMEEARPEDKELVRAIGNAVGA